MPAYTITTMDKKQRYARQLRVTIGDNYNWKNRPNFIVDHNAYSPERTLELRLLQGRDFNYRGFMDKLESLGWEVIKLFPKIEQFDSGVKIDLPVIALWVRKIEDVDILQDEKCDCLGSGKDCCIIHSDEPPRSFTTGGKAYVTHENPTKSVLVKS